jgi:hypothetical protein
MNAESRFHNYAVYIWQGNSPDGVREGYWHIVKVENKLPGRCGGACGKAPGIDEPHWPVLHTYTTGFLDTKRCTSLVDFIGLSAPPEGTDTCNEEYDYQRPGRCFQGGLVKSMVARWDENKDLTLTLANRVPVFRFISHHPERGPATLGMVTTMVTECADEGATAGAFMLNRRTAGNESCWMAAHLLLERGVMTRSCAQYFPHMNRPYGFNMKFVNCNVVPW